MADKPKYLLGKGELLAKEIAPPGKPQKKAHPYSYAEVRERLTPRLSLVSRRVAELPQEACPDDQSVAAVVLHPAYLAKSFFPERLFATMGFESLGSKPVHIKPSKGAKTKDVDGKKIEIESPTVEIFVAGRRHSFQRWADVTQANDPRFGRVDVLEEEMIRIEDVRVITSKERLKPLVSTTDFPLMEVVLHSGADFVLRGFRDYLKTFDIAVDLDRRIEAQNL